MVIPDEGSAASNCGMMKPVSDKRISSDPDILKRFVLE